MERLLAEQARIQQERNAVMAAQRQALIKRDEERRAQQREQEKSKIYYFLEPNRGLLTQAQPNFWTEPRRAGHPVEGAPAGAKVRLFGNTGDKTWLLIQVLRTGNESEYGGKYWVERPYVKILGTETDVLRAELEEQERLRQEQERQAELVRQQQAQERQAGRSRTTGRRGGPRSQGNRANLLRFPRNPASLQFLLRHCRRVLPVFADLPGGH